MKENNYPNELKDDDQIQTKENCIHTTNEEKSISNYLLIIPPYMIAVSIGILLIILGLFLLYTSLLQNLKLGIILIVMGGISFYLNTEKKRSGKNLLISEKMTIIIAIVLFVSFFATTNFDLTFFFQFIFICLLIIKIFTQSYLTGILEIKMKIIILTFFIIIVGLIINIILPYITTKV